MKKAAAAVIVSLLFCVGIFTLFGMTDDKAVKGATFIERVESSVSENLPFRELVSSVITRIRYVSGRRYFDGIYIGSEGSLLYNKKDYSKYHKSTEELLKYADKFGEDTYFMLVPNALAIREQEVDEYAYQGFANQRSIMTDIYMDLYKKFKTVDIYQSLYNHKDEYIYYRTEDAPTMLGGFYIYTSLGKRMELKTCEQKDFSVAYVEKGFYGGLAKEELKPYAVSDFISLYEYINKPLIKTLHYNEQGESDEMDGLYVQSKEDLADRTDIILGGLSPVTEIFSKDGEGSLLVFCDDTGKCWLPFMSLHFNKITAVNISDVTEEMLSEIDYTGYDKVVFAFSLSTYSDGIDFSKLGLLK